MIKLEAQNTTFGGIFYFHTMQDCKDFMYVFKDHWCNVPWNTPVEITSDTYISEDLKREMDKPPKKRAQDNLSWGFNLVERLDIDLTKEQNNFVKSMMTKIS